MLGPQALAQAYPIGGVSPADWVGFDKSAEAIVARYRLDGLDKNQEATLIVALYPTQQIASEKYDKLGRWFALNARTPPKLPVPRRTPTGFSPPSSAMIAVLAGVTSRPVAVDLLNHIHYASTVTWNEPSFTLTHPGIGPMVVGAFMGTGVIMVLAIAAASASAGSGCSSSYCCRVKYSTAPIASRFCSWALPASPSVLAISINSILEVPILTAGQIRES